MLLTYGDVAKKLGVSSAVVRKWVERKLIPHLRLGDRTVRFDEKDLDDWIKARSVAASGPGDASAPPRS